MNYDQFFPQFSSVLVHFFWVKKNAQCYDRSFCIPEFFFVRFLVFELLSILDFTVVNSDLGLRRWVGKQRSVALQNMPLALTCFN